MRTRAFRLNSAACACYLRAPPPVTPCPTFCSNCSPRKSPRACRRARRRTCASSSPTGWSRPGSSTRAPRPSSRRAGWRSRCRACRSRQPDVQGGEEGPARRRARAARSQGFLQRRRARRRSTEAKVQPDKKGDFYVAVIEKPGRPAIEVIAEIVPEVVQHVSLAEVDALGRASAKPGALTWVRPLHSIVATFGPETEEPEIVPFAVDGIAAGDDDARPPLHGAGAVQGAPLRRLRRQAREGQGRARPGAAQGDHPRRRQEPRLRAGLELVEDEGLLAEVAGLVEWPVVLMGSFDEAFLADPARGDPHHHPQQPEMLRAARSADRASSPTSSSWSPTSRPTDGGKAIVAGNERVIRARLSDAKFFYETDLKTRLEDRLPKFEHIVFHEKLGTPGRADRAHRGARGRARAASSAPTSRRPKRAARLCKADLLTEVVGEFPELQGLMGKYYARGAGRGRSGRRTPARITTSRRARTICVPADPVSVAVALADKIDTLVGFWAIDEKPTGIKDPYALRRAALGVIRIVLVEQATPTSLDARRSDCVRACTHRCAISASKATVRR